MRALFVALLLAPLMLANPAWAANWKTNHEGKAKGEVTTYVRDVSNSPVKAFKGIVEVKASATSVLAVITAVDTFPEWIFQNQGAKRLSVEDREEIHMRFNGIWPVSDRDVVLANTLSLTADTDSRHSDNSRQELYIHGRRMIHGTVIIHGSAAAYIHGSCSDNSRQLQQLFTAAAVNIHGSGSEYSRQRSTHSQGGVQGH